MWPSPCISPGVVTSLTVTVNEPCAVAPRVSVTVQFTVVVPMANVLPKAGVHTAVRAPSSTSLPDAVKVTTAPVRAVAVAVMLAGTVIVGALFSTSTLKEPPIVLPCASVTEQFTVVVPMANMLPLAVAV